MLARNETPFAAIGFAQLHRDGDLMACLAVRASYTLGADGAVELADRQETVLVDEHEGDPHRTPMRRVGDLIPFKPAADVTLVGSAHAPAGRPARTWPVELSVGGHTARLRVHGPRQWQPGLTLLKPTWKLGEAEPAAAVPLDYRRAAGGRFLGDPDGEVDRRNPIGPGIAHRDHTRPGRPFPAPQIDSPAAPVAGPYDAPEPQGFGPIPPWWEPRQRHAGTYDEAWKAERHPRLPGDFDYRFYQTAHPGLILPGYLHGSEAVRVSGCRPGGAALSFTLPGVVPVADHAWDDGRAVRSRLNLDGLHLDLSGERPRLDLTWRGWIARCPAYLFAVLSLLSLDEARGLPGCGAHGLTEAEDAA
ncbi:DUF2169 domain-containing protein [Methylobacterium terrae]|uniref:DUF2169 domain-containing protein n=1 Tax=Methylobacterium terrae TaxID=2202827 RepID=A0A2U8WSA6_9HYPH|nr:DUF2169 domain-containing protein [Methylobacterium terrae]AWN49089.1 DUF2169 domain-containing protein [Methylobacterium terrae]